MILICSTYVHQSAKLCWNRHLIPIKSPPSAGVQKSKQPSETWLDTVCVEEMRCSETGLTGFPLKEGLNKSDESEVNCIQVPLFGRAYLNLFMKMEFFLWVCVPWEQNCVYLFHDAQIREGVQRVSMPLNFSKLAFSGHPTRSLNGFLWINLSYSTEFWRYPQDVETSLKTYRQGICSTNQFTSHLQEGPAFRWERNQLLKDIPLYHVMSYLFPW